MFFLTRAHQHVLLQEALDSLELFIPLEDHFSANALKADLLDWLTRHSGRGLPIVNELVKILLLPAYLIFWFWRRAQKPPGWRVNFQNRTFTPTTQNNQFPIKGADVLGIHLHGQTIEITHPTQGPLITLHKFARIGDEDDLAALNQLVERLAARLNFRIVGQRATLIPATYEVFLFVVSGVISLSLLGALVFHVKA